MSTAQAAPSSDNPIDPARRYVTGEVRAATARVGMNQRAVGRLLGISHAAVGRRFSNEVAWDADELVKISVATGVPAAQFFPPLDFGPDGPLAQLVELRTFNPKSGGHLRLVSANRNPELSLHPSTSPVRLIRA